MMKDEKYSCKERKYFLLLVVVLHVMTMTLGARTGLQSIVLST